MIKITDDSQVIVSDGDCEYAIGVNADDYKKFVMHVTNPDPEFKFDEDMLLIDEDLDKASEEYALALRYAEFLQAFLEKRDGIIAERADAIRAGNDAIDSVIESMEDIVEEFEGQD